MSTLDRFVAWACDRRYREELAGDLAELRARRVERLGRRVAFAFALRDAVSACLLLPRTGPATLRRLLTAASVLVLAVAFLPRGPAPTAIGHYTVSASDPYGDFTLEIDGTRVVAATLDGAPVPAARLKQSRNRVVILAGAGRGDLEVRIKPEGGITWAARTPRTPASAGP